jgi:hypothetical protein
MVKISKQHADKNHKYSVKAVIAEGKIAPSYKMLMTGFCQVIQDKLGLDATVKSPKVLGATEIAMSVQQHYDFVELVINEILILGDEYSLFPEFGIFVNKNQQDNSYSCISFKLKVGNGYFVQISRYIGKLTNVGTGMYETKVKVGNNFELVKSPTILGLFDEIDSICNQPKTGGPTMDPAFFEDAVESHIKTAEQPVVVVHQ